MEIVRRRVSNIVHITPSSNNYVVHLKNMYERSSVAPVNVCRLMSVGLQPKHRRQTPPYFNLHHFIQRSQLMYVFMLHVQTVCS
jgi:hypothetical protein